MLSECREYLLLLILREIRFHDLDLPSLKRVNDPIRCHRPDKNKERRRARCHILSRISTELAVDSHLHKARGPIIPVSWRALGRFFPGSQLTIAASSI